MALGGRELRLILSIQSYGTSNIQRLRRDILSLAATTKAANSMQVAVADQILRQSQKIERIESRIATMRASNASRRAALNTSEFAAETRFARMRQRNAAAQVATANTIARRQFAIDSAHAKNWENAIKSQARFDVQNAGLLTRRLQAQQKISNFTAEEHALSARLLNNKATILGHARRVAQLERQQADSVAKSVGGEELLNSRLKEANLRLQASRTTRRQLGVLARNLNQQQAIYESQLASINAQQQLLNAGKQAEAAAIARSVELTALQQNEMGALLEKQGAIQAELAVIDRQEALVDEQLRAQLVSLEAQSAEIERQIGLYNVEKGKLAELLAIDKERAVAIDAQTSRQQRLLRRETRARTFAHGARTAQFAGLIGLAATAMPAAAFARFNEQTTLAATQVRQVGQSAADTLKQVDTFTNGIHENGKSIEGILELMGQFPAPAEDMAKAAYDIASSMNVDQEGTLKLLKLFNQLAVATGSDLNEATQAGITVLNDFGGSANNAGRQINLMMAIIRFGRMRLADLNAMLTKVAPAALAAGMNLKNVAGAMVLITRVQPSQRVGATGIARLLQTFRDPDFQRGIFRASGGLLSIAKGGKGGVGALKPLPQIINAIAHSFGLFTKFGGPQQLFKQLTAVGAGTGIGRQSRIEAANAFTFLIRNNEEYQRLQRRTISDTDEFSQALKAMSASPGVQWRVFTNGMKALAITFGEDVLPALLQLVDLFTRLAHWFESLSESTRQWIARIALFGSVGALVVGTIGNMIAGLVSLQANLAITRGAFAATAAEAEASAGKIAIFSSVISSLIGLGVIAIPIVVQLLRGGDPGVWSLLSAAGFGAAGGFLIGGPVGAAVGAITVPLVVEFISKFQEPKDPIKAAYEKYRREALHEGGRFSTAIIQSIPKLEDLRNKLTGNQALAFNEWLKLHPKYLRMWRKQQQSHDSTTSKDFNRNWQKMLGDYKNASGNLNKLYQDQNTKQTQAQQQAVQLAKHHAEAMKQALDNRNQKIKQAVDNLGQIYESLRQQNEQAFGTIGQGPVMSGVFGSIFTQLNDLLYQFGVQIPIPFSLIRKDFDQQKKYFIRFNNDLAKLAKRGAPFPLIQQIQAMGPQAGEPIVMGLLQGGKKGFKALMRDWKASQKLLGKVTKAQLDAQLKYWESFGKSAAWRLVNGVTTSPEWAKLAPHFRKYVVNTFGGILRRQLKQEVAKDMKAFRASLAAEAAASAAAAPKIPTGLAGGAGGRAAGRSAVDVTRSARQAASRARREAGQQMAEIRRYTAFIQSPRSIGGRRITPREHRILHGMIMDREKTIARAQAAAGVAKRIQDDRQARRQATYWTNSIRAAERWARTTGSPGGARVTPGEMRTIHTMERRRSTALARARADEHAIVRWQLQHNPRSRGMVNITYGGDTVHMHTGASVKDVEKALDRQAFKRRHKRHRHTKTRGR